MSVSSLFIRPFIFLLSGAIVVIAAGSDLQAQTGVPDLQRWVRYEVRARLQQVGLPAPTPASMANATRQPAAISLIRREFDQVDWPAAVRTGVRNATVRGGNGLGVISDDELRTAVTDSVIESWNDAAQQQTDTSRFQKLVEEGVEDAIVELFNELGKQQPHSDIPVETPQAEPPERRGMSLNLAQHLPPNHGAYFPARYRRLDLVYAGWFREPGGEWIPLPRDSVVIALRRDDLTTYDLYRHGRLLATKANYTAKLDGSH